MPYHAGSCVMCGACEKRCPYGLPIRDMLEGVARVVKLEHGPVGYGLGHIAGHVRPFSAGACGHRPYRPGRLAQTAQVGARIRRGAGLRPSAVGSVGVCISSRVRPLTRRMPFYGQNRKILLSAPGHQRQLLDALQSDCPVLAPEPLEPERSRRPAGEPPRPCRTSPFLSPKRRPLPTSARCSSGRTTCSTRTRTPPATKTGE